MAWVVNFSDKAERQIKRLDPTIRRRIVEFLEERLARLPNPRSLGAPLTGDLKGLWRYRIGDYRILCEFKDDELIVLVIEVGHRSDIYR